VRETVHVRGRLESHAAAYARVAIANVRREYPHQPSLVLTEPGAGLRPRDLHPAFYGSLDWHSCVEMFWVLARVLRLSRSAVPEGEIRAALEEHLTAERLSAEAAFFSKLAHAGIERPYGWAWALALAHELASWEDTDARRWSANMRPLTDVLVRRYLDWLPKATYPIRTGTHQNSAFAISLTLPFARAEHPDLYAALTEAAGRWFANDKDFPAQFEPSGADFLSPALTEAELMIAIITPDAYANWLQGFLPRLDKGEPNTLFTPAIISDPSDGQIAHLHGLNLSRAWCWQRIADSLPAKDPRQRTIEAAVNAHTQASLHAAVGSDYMVEHWLAAYAVLLLSSTGLRRGDPTGSLIKTSQLR
jgi:hypothetical protein